MATPTITPMQTPFPDKGQSQAAFDYNVDGLMNLFDSMTTELPIALDWIEDRVNEVAATAIGGDLPDITGQATNMLRLNAAGDAAEFRTPAQVVQDLGSGTTGRELFAAETPEDGRDALGVATVIDEDDFSTDSATRPPSQQSTAAYFAANSIGHDQDWVDVTATRVSGIYYTNLTSRPIAVSIKSNSSTLSLFYVKAPGEAEVVVGDIIQNGGDQRPLFTIVPPGHAYKLESGSAERWVELR